MLNFAAVQAAFINSLAFTGKIGMGSKRIIFIFGGIIFLLLLGAGFYFFSKDFLPFGDQSSKETSRFVLPKIVEPEPTPTPTPTPPTSQEPEPTQPPPEPTPPPPEPTPEPEPPPPDPEPQAKLHIISIDAEGFSPKIITIFVGDTIRWVNNDTELHWPSADPHPTHSELPEFDPLADLSSGEFYEFTFMEPRVVSYHDHTAALEEDEATITGGIRVLPRE